MRLEVPADVLTAVADHGERAYSEECCGVLVGRALADGGAAVVRAVAAENERGEERGRRYVIGAETVLRADRAARAEGLAIVGYYHSHPDHPAVPSAFDREHAWAGVSYLIVPVEGGTAGPARSWRLAGDGGDFVEEAVVPLGGPAPVRPDEGTMSAPVNTPTPASAENPSASDSGAGAAAAGAAPPSTPSVSDLPELSADEVRRYARHLIMPEVGAEGQRRLKAARVLLIGTGGLGSPLGLYLAAAGVGRLGLVDFDRVEVSNLHRQVLFGDADLGRPKVEAAIDRLRGINPHVELVPHEVRLDSSNALGLFAGYDLVVDGSDNFPTRYLVNDACVLAGKPNVYGSIFRFEGQVSVFWGARGPCYRCLFPEPPPPGLVPSCAEGGVLGVLPGIVGALQANEAIKLILGAGDPLIGRLLLFDALRMRFRELKLRKSPDCPVCSERPTQTGLIDYDQFCGQAAAVSGGDAAAAEAPGFEVGVRTLAQWLEEGREVTVLDVRGRREWEVARLPGAKLIPLRELPDRLGDLDPTATVVVHCHHGPRSTQAVALLRGHGFSRAYNLAGGIDAWSVEIDPGVPRY